MTQIPEGFTIMSMPQSIEPVAFHIDFSRFISFDVNYYIVVGTLLFMDLFDTIGTLIGAVTGAEMADKFGKIPALNKALMADAVGTTIGAFFVVLPLSQHTLRARQVSSREAVRV